MKNFMILINGPAGAGKSTIAEKLWKKSPRTALISLDEIKFLISDRKSNSFEVDLASKIGRLITKEYLKNNINVIVEKAFCEYKYLKPFIKIAKQKKIKILVYNIEAPIKIVKQRAKDRKRKMKQKRVSDLYNHYSKSKFPVDRIFDSSKQSANKIVNQILSDLKIKKRVNKKIISKNI